MRKLIFVLLLALTLSAGFAQAFHAVFEIGGTGDYLQDLAYNGDSFAGITISPLQRVGVTPVSSPGNFTASNWPHVNDANGGNLDEDKYIGFTITADTDYEFTVNYINFWICRSGTGTRQTEWRGSADNYNASFANYSYLYCLDNIGGVLHNEDVYQWGWPAEHRYFGGVLYPGTTYENLTSCGFRMYMHHAEHPGGTAGFPYSIEINGVVRYTGSSGSLDVSTNSLSGFRYEHGAGPSYTKLLRICGGSTYGSVTVSLPADSKYEINTPGSSFTNTLTCNLNRMSGDFYVADVSVRLKAGLAIGDYNDIITVTRTGFADKTISCSGSVTQPATPPPTPPPPPLVYVADFEAISEPKTGFTPGVVVVSGLDWMLDQCLIGNDQNDYYEGTRSARLDGNNASANMTMLVDKMWGIGDVTFKYRSYGSDAQAQWKVEYSYDGGINWYPAGDPFTASNQVQTFSAHIGESRHSRLRILRTNADPISGGRLNIDNIQLTDYHDIFVDETKVVGDYTITLTVGNDGGPANIAKDVAVTDLSGTGSTIAYQHCLDLFGGTGPWIFDVTGPLGSWVAFKYYDEEPWDTYDLGSGTVQYEIYIPKYTGQYDLGAGIELVLGSGSKPGDPTLPVTLSHFSATMTAQNYVNLTWVSQTETNLMGYNVLRGNSEDLGSAMQICPMIAATNTSQAQTYTYLDKELVEDGTYYYWLQNVDMDGTTGFHGPASVVFSITGNTGTPSIPKVTKLEDAYPNPFNPNTTIRYQLEKPGRVEIDIYNTKGQIVRSFSQNHDAAGYYNILWDGCDNSGRALASGVYLYKMTSGKYSGTKKLVLQK